MMQPPLRVTTVPYLNIEPFVQALTEVTPCETLRRVPSALLERWRAGHDDLCLLSAADAIREGVEPLDGACIASPGPVLSVRLVSDSPPAAWDRVVLDPDSVTSNQLTRLLLKQRSLAASVDFVSGRFVRTPGEFDASVVIGDRALACPRHTFDRDLAEWWREETDLPFVFAVWVPGRRTQYSRKYLEELLTLACLDAPRHIDRCVASHVRRTGLPAERLREYLDTALSYRFAEAEQRGFESFSTSFRLRRERVLSSAPALGNSSLRVCS